VRRVRLAFLPGLYVEFTDRERALKQVEEFARRGTRFPVVIFGPEGCGKTAFLQQASAVLEELGYEVFYLHPLERRFRAELTVPDLKREFMEFIERALGEEALGRIAWVTLDFARKLLRAKRTKVAVIADDVFHVIGLDTAAAYVKALLNLIEYPGFRYENIVVLVATSEGVSRREIGRHRWAHLTPMWNMPREGFRQLYDKIPGPKQPFEEAWRWTGGNPNMLVELYKAGWDVDEVAKRLVIGKGLGSFVRSLSREARELLWGAVGDPDSLLSPEGVPLLEKLVEKNLLVDSITYRDPPLWIDQPPPERDLELGIGKNAAWQTPLHREAVRRALQEA
jgi:hypothetical protein